MTRCRGEPQAGRGLPIHAGLGLSFAAWLAVSCATTKPGEVSDHPAPVKEFSTKNIYPSSNQPGCMMMFDAYCDYLYSPEVSGNLKIQRGPDSLFVLQGKTNNDFTNVEFAYSKAKMRNQSLLPKDFLEALDARNYFYQLGRLLARNPREKMTLYERMRMERLDEELDAMWNSALNETVLKRMERKYPGYHKIKEELVPVELRLERRRVRRVLISEISTSIWRHHPNWKKVEDSFERLREHFLKMIARLDVPESIRQSWRARVGSIRLVLPGSMPAIADDECATTKVNAYYYPYLNVITVCAGDFNSEDILATLAHEMAHALDIDRSIYLAQVNSGFGKSLAGLRENVCRPEGFSCADWSAFKSRFSTALTDLRAFRPELPEFQKCLKIRPTEKSLAEEDLTRLAEISVKDKLSELARADVFLRITKDKIPLPNGKTGSNPNYLNPCSYALWTRNEEPIDDEITSLVFFTAEYRCSEGESVDRFRAALDKAKAMTVALVRESLRMESEFSDRRLMEREGFSSSPAERFADVVGSYALAELLGSMPSLWDRRNVYLASNSWQCPKPSLGSRFPAESAVQREFIFDSSHAEGNDRKAESFSSPIRGTIGCEKDFEFRSCELPFKKAD